MGTFKTIDFLFRRMGLPALALMLYACANVVSPTGGPRDEDPPVVVRSEPPNFSANFTGGEVRIYFDEFVELRNVRQQLMISPPLEKTPDFRVRGRSIVFDTGTDLRENTTYSFFLGDAIRDITEGNALPNFSFVFSTGDYVDSLSVRGKVLDAFTLEPVKDVLVMMYDRMPEEEKLIDSVPYLERPVYVAKTGAEGQFRIGNMREGDYLMFALVDNNANYLYDLPEEKIAFIDSLVRPEYVPPPAPAGPDILGLDADAPDLPTDTLDPDMPVDPGLMDPEGTLPARTEGTGPVEPEEPETEPEVPETGLEEPEVSETDPEDLEIPETSPEEPEPDRREQQPASYTLYLFQEADTVQRITGAQALRAGRLRITFRVPFDSLEIRDVRQELAADWSITEINRTRDTLTLWLNEPKPDSLFLEISDRGRVLDTLKLSSRPRPAGRRTAEEADEPLPEVQLTMDAIRRNTWPYYLPIGFRASAPVDTLDGSLISIWKNDTIPLEGRFFTEDPVRRKFELDLEVEEEQRYTLEFLPGAVTDIFGATHDTIRRAFSTNSPADYGKLIMNIALPESDAGDAEPWFILQLLDQNGRTLREKTLTEDGNYSFLNLAAGNYGLRLIEDRNRNGRWDPGIFLKGIQPEPVYMYSGQLQVRENWELEMPWQPRR